MKTLFPRLLTTFGVLTVLLFFANVAAADSLTGSVNITWLFPNTSTVFATDTIAVGSSLACPGSSPICSGYGGFGSETFSVASSSINYNVDLPNKYTVAPFNGFDFSGLAFASSGSLTGFSLVTDIAGLTPSDVTFGSNFIEVNLQGLQTNGSFTLGLTSSAAAVPEPGTLALLLAGLGVLGLISISWRSRLFAL